MNEDLQPILNHKADGRMYKIGAAENVEVIFKADGTEVGNKYAVTEWWMEKGAPGVDAHVHETNDELIYALEGTVSILVGDKWENMSQGGLAVIPAGTRHGFRNNSTQRIGVLNIFLSGAYEAMMPQIQAMFADRK